MTDEKTIEVLSSMAERLRWPFKGEPGSNPDYLDSEEQDAIAEAIQCIKDRIER